MPRNKTKKSKSKARDTGGSADQSQNQNTAPVSAQDQALLRALHAFIVPHEAGVDGNIQKRKDDLDQKVSGPEAAMLIAELKGFMSRLTEQPTVPEEIKIKVELEKAFEEPENEYGANAESPEAITHEPYTSFKGWFLEQLHYRVYNEMPIRLLSFEQHGSIFEIKLLERNDIMALFEAKLPKIWELQFSSSVPLNYLAINDCVQYLTSYAILSHTWLRSNPGEITYSDWINQRFNTNDAGYQKLNKFCQTSFADHHISLGWMDTICINKDSSSELDESIRSMYRWYQSSKICIVYLAKTSMISEIHQDPWFTRGWTLQELLAPDYVKFYNRNWVKFDEDCQNDKPYRGGHNLLDPPCSPTIMDQIQHATTISKDELLNISIAPFSRRMEMAANRNVTREEDMAYSLMGIFNVSISTAYGEGSKHAFLRLLEAIFYSHQYGTLDLLNWSGLYESNFSPSSRILPSNPKVYTSRSSSIILQAIKPFEVLTMTSFGLRIPVLLMPAKSAKIHSSQFKARGNYSARVPVKYSYGIKTYCLLDSTISGPDQFAKFEKRKDIFQHTFAVFNIEQRNGKIYIPQTCIAILLDCNEDAGKVTSTGTVEHVRTKEPIVFKMQQKINVETDQFVDVNKDGILLAEDDLAKHGMQLVIKYL
ncbi:hypothetical protein BDN70DRAFT_991405 [Pholiota conissans]|uniref:Heterokaryon incompatibility domain-containing protein n=1 Tax=Pholiota conissans TaxID=109636 RepID=A0A9P6CVR1_9AGAR|nr:hypothetical protein BDN70DRAFT_991405 [Pholiota conissans]